MEKSKISDMHHGQIAFSVENFKIHLNGGVY